MPQLVLIRHGQSTWNLENRFTGWWDVDDDREGRGGSAGGGRVDGGARGLDFDLTFTSLQTRAIKTLNIALEAMGRLWLPTEKHWRLNERHYGGLTGLNKAETAAKHGDDAGARSGGAASTSRRRRWPRAANSIWPATGATRASRCRRPRA